MSPEALFNSILKKFLHNKFTDKAQYQTVNRQKVFISIPYIGSDSCKLKLDITRLLFTFYPQIKSFLYFKNNFKIGTFFRNSDPSNTLLQSSVVYKHTCDLCEQVNI